MMNETETPILHISGTVSERDYKAAIRALGLRTFIRYALYSLAACVLINLCTSLHWIKDGYISFGKWLRDIWFYGLFGSYAWYVAAFLALYALLFFVIAPSRAGKRMRELHPDGVPVTYDFYGEQLVIQSATQTADETVRIKYADVQRRIRENKYIIILSTNQRNRFGVYKTVMTPEEVEIVTGLLQTNCPQHKPRRK